MAERTGENNARRVSCWPIMRPRRDDDKKDICAELREAVDQKEGAMGRTIELHQKLIINYYEDVRDQANMSFDAALCAAVFGFVVLVLTLAYALVFDGLNRFGIVTNPPQGSLTASELGIISGALIEFIASVAFALYALGVKQFSAFHICLERTHRYLLAFKIAQQIAKEERDKSLHALLCIMARAPMVRFDDIGSKQTDRPPMQNT